MNIFTKLKRDIIAIATDLLALELHTDFTVELPKTVEYGDFSTNFAMVYAPIAKQNSKHIAQILATQITERLDYITEASVAGPGFINFRVTIDTWHELISSILSDDAEFFAPSLANLTPINLEYVSANPTGPLHIGHARGAVYGEALARLLERTGHQVTREYYINDAGTQIDKLVDSCYLRYLEALGEGSQEITAGLYPGDYLIPIGAELASNYGKTLKEMSKAARDVIIKKITLDSILNEIKDDLALIHVKHDIFFSETTLHQSNKIHDVIELLKDKGLIYQGTLPVPKGGEVEQDWEPQTQTLFNATAFGDDIDRVVIKSNGTPTYLAADMAYHQDKISRGAKNMILVLGADHGGYIKRIKAIVSALSNKEAVVDIKIMQLVNFVSQGEPVKMSKRAGTYLTLREVVERVGADALKFTMMTKKHDTKLDFDFDKICEQSKDNPIFYVQYASARVNSATKRAELLFGINLADLIASKTQDERCAILALLNAESDMAIIRTLASFPRILMAAVQYSEPHRLAFYLYDLAEAVHNAWNFGIVNKDARFVSENKDLTLARMMMMLAVKKTIISGLEIFGISALEEML